MNVFQKIKTMLNVKTLVVTIIATSVVSPLVAAADPGPFQDEWIVKVKTEEMQRQFDYKNSTLRGVAKVTVEYGKITDKSKTPYETVWYHDGKPIGLERTGKFGLPRNELAILEVTHAGKASDQEVKAAANIIVRLRQDGYHNADGFFIKMPLASFDAISSELQKSQRLSESREGGDVVKAAKMSFSMESEPEGKRQTLFFY